MRNTEIENNIEYQLNEQKRTKDKVKEYLHTGDTLVVQKIKRRGNKRLGYTYVLFLKQPQGIFSINFSCFVEGAISSGELLILKD